MIKTTLLIAGVSVLALLTTISAMIRLLSMLPINQITSPLVQAEHHKNRGAALDPPSIFFIELKENSI
jgi:hypothetical protein